MKIGKPYFEMITSTTTLICQMYQTVKLKTITMHDTLPTCSFWLNVWQCLHIQRLRMWVQSFPWPHKPSCDLYSFPQPSMYNESCLQFHQSFPTQTLIQATNTLPSLTNAMINSIRMTWLKRCFSIESFDVLNSECKGDLFMLD